MGGSTGTEENYNAGESSDRRLIRSPADTQKSPPMLSWWSRSAPPPPPDVLSWLFGAAVPATADPMESGMFGSIWSPDSLMATLASCTCFAIALLAAFRQGHSLSKHRIFKRSRSAEEGTAECVLTIVHVNDICACTQLHLCALTCSFVALTVRSLHSRGSRCRYSGQPASAEDASGRGAREWSQRAADARRRLPRA